MMCVHSKYNGTGCVWFCGSYNYNVCLSVCTSFHIVSRCALYQMYQIWFCDDHKAPGVSDVGSRIRSLSLSLSLHFNGIFQVNLG